MFRADIERLAAFGLHTHRASGWGEALALARELRPAAVLLDSGFLEGAGPQLCGALRRSWGPSEMPVLAICGGPREVKWALSAGASDIVERPPNWDLVGRRLLALASAQRTTAELEHNRRQLAQAHVALADGRRKFEQENLIDSLTRLPNRFQIERILERALLADAGPVALIALDLDRFSELNETLGRKTGDEILRLSAERLTACLKNLPGRGGAGPGLMSAARLGGAEFAIVLRDSDAARLAGLARFVLDALGKRMTVGDHQLHLSASLGIAVAAQPNVAPETLLRHAETAMYQAKRAGGGQSHVYHPDLGITAESRLNMGRRLLEVFERGALELHYQPLLAAESRRVLGVEALLRWNDPERGWIPPAEFIPVAETMGLMGEIGVWVLETACGQLRAWLDDGLPQIRIAVNVSRRQLEIGDFAAEVKRVLCETRLDPALLELELSERGALHRDPQIMAQLRRLKAIGVRLVVDDFGTGETAVSQLRGHDLDGLKIDGSFVRDSLGEDGPVLTAAMTAMGRHLSLHVVAEGVETEAELVKMREYGCHAVQGFLFSHPLPPAELRRRIMLPLDRPDVCELMAVA